MPTRFYLPSSGTTPETPTISAEWEHSSGIRVPMSTTDGSTALTSTAYTPDGADHLVDGDALHVQFVSNPLSAQTISAQTVTISVKGLMAHANNAQSLTWKLFVWTAADTVGSTILAIRRDATAYTTTLINRTDAATTTSVTVGAGDRIVLEVGTGGLPTAAGGTQGHNATLRWGESGATDAPANDTSTSTTENPWIEFANVITFLPPPATSDPADLRVDVRGAVASVRASTTGGGMRGYLSTAITTAVRARRAIVTWAQFVVPVSTAIGATTITRTRAAIRLATSVVAAHGTAVGLRALARQAASSTRATTATIQARVAARGALVAVATTPGLTTGVARGLVRSRGSLVALRAMTGTAGSLTRGSAQLVVMRNTPAVARMRVLPWTTPVVLGEHRAVAQVRSSGLVAAQAEGKAILVQVALLGEARQSLTVVSGHLGLARLGGRFWVDAPGTFVLSIQTPFAVLDPINLGYTYRGDTMILPVWQAVDPAGNVIDLTDASLWFTAKVDLAMTDVSAPTIQVSNDTGDIAILDPKNGLYRVTVSPVATQPLDDDALYTFDVQVITAALVTRTIRRGALIVVRDVTRVMA